MPIKDDAYNKARDILAKAGSKSAKKSHMKHTGKKGSPDGHGKSLIDEARADGVDEATLAKAEKAMGI
jgi:hypothetical protein